MTNMKQPKCVFCGAGHINVILTSADGVEWCQRCFKVQNAPAVPVSTFHQKECNAALIAAAPDLLHALRRILTCRTIRNGGPLDMWTDARNAWAKALGLESFSDMLDSNGRIKEEYYRG